MTKKDLLIIADYSEQDLIPVEEVCEICGISNKTLNKLIEYEIIQMDQTSHQLFFNVAQLNRIQTAIRLKRQLEVSTQAVAVILDLLDELETLRSRVEVFEKHYLK